MTSERFNVSYREIRQFWDINEVAKAGEWLDMQDDSEWLAAEESQIKAQGAKGRA